MRGLDELQLAIDLLGCDPISVVAVGTQRVEEISQHDRGRGTLDRLDQRAIGIGLALPAVDQDVETRVANLQPRETLLQALEQLDIGVLVRLQKAHIEGFSGMNDAPHLKVCHSTRCNNP